MPAVERPTAGGVIEVVFDASAGNVTYELPWAFAPGRKMRLRRIDSSSYTATATVASGGVVDGVTDGTISVPANTVIDLDKYDGNVWESYGAGDPAGNYGPNVGSDAWLKLHAGGDLDALITGAVTRDSNGAATSAGVVWPDGKTGTYTATTVSTAFPGAVDAYTVTYAGTPTKTVTQSAVTRDATTGAVTTRPAMTVS